MKVKRTVTIDEEIDQKLDEMRAGKTQFFSNYINDVLRKELGFGGKHTAGVKK